uniref:Spermatogenesis associated 17 n=1 Tax=Varanus komodoensis TaxID=61221 RepID=A0A8D2IMI2_VARKO
MKEKEEVKKALERKEKKKDYLARKMHYLLSTEQIAGVYNSPYRSSPDPMELQLRKVKPLRHKKKGIQDITNLKYQKMNNSSIKHIPFSCSCQGPFRNTGEVLQQRFKPLEPSLQGAASNFSLQLAREKVKQEEWRNRIHDNRSRRTNKDIFRCPRQFQSQNQAQNWIEMNPDDFITVLPSIPLFGKFGQTYSRSGQIV